MSEALNELQEKAVKAIEEAGSLDELRQVEIRLLGRKGSLTRVLRDVSRLPAAARPKAGRLANELKREVQERIESRRRLLEEEEIGQKLIEPEFDVTLPGVPVWRGRLHPVTRLLYEIEDVFRRLGFAVLEGPEVETDYYNFTALNIPPGHPARDMQDTFYLEDGLLLRTHTSPVQIRTMERFPPPIRAIFPGRVFRHEVIDASHETTFNQIEGLMVDRDISVGHLVAVLRILMEHLFGKGVAIRIRPGYFPFVEPGLELELGCSFCDGAGCRVCKQAGWIEILGCGPVHPNVLRAGGVDPEVYSGFAFGMGVERLVMRRYAINDIRHFLSGDVRFLRQF